MSHVKYIDRPLASFEEDGFQKLLRRNSISGEGDQVLATLRSMEHIANRDGGPGEISARLLIRARDGLEKGAAFTFTPESAHGKAITMTAVLGNVARDAAVDFAGRIVAENQAKGMIGVLKSVGADIQKRVRMTERVDFDREGNLDDMYDELLYLTHGQSFVLHARPRAFEMSAESALWTPANATSPPANDNPPREGGEILILSPEMAIPPAPALVSGLMRDALKETVRIGADIARDAIADAFDGPDEKPDSDGDADADADGAPSKVLKLAAKADEPVKTKIEVPAPITPTAPALQHAWPVEASGLQPPFPAPYADAGNYNRQALNVTAEAKPNGWLTGFRWLRFTLAWSSENRSGPNDGRKK